jgi:hypothetical protein
MDVVSENKNEMVEIIGKDIDEVRKEILANFALGREDQKSSIT